MYDVETTEVFDKWLTSIKDIMTRQIIVKRMQAMVSGRLGQTRSLGGGLFEAKIHFRQGIRLYFVNKNGRIIILLYGGGKSTQKADIEKAKKIAEELENDKNEKI